MTPITIRPATTDDRAYLLSATRETLLKNSAYCHGLHPATVNVLLEPLFATYQTIVAAAADDPTTILGFILFRSATEVAFIYVRSQFRGHGIARALLTAAKTEPGEIACALMVTKLGGQNFPRLAESKGFRLRFRPYIALEISAEVLVGRAKA